jgi:hypothetical protein
MVSAVQPRPSLAGSVAAGADAHFLVAYASGDGVNVADVDFRNTTGTAQTTTNMAGVDIYASDIVHLTGVSTTALANANIHFA